MDALQLSRREQEALAAPAGTLFEYAVMAYGRTIVEAVEDARRWQTRPGLQGAGSALYGRRTAPVSFGVPTAVSQPGWQGWRQYRVPCTWVVTDERLPDENRPLGALKAAHAVELASRLERWA